jgi:low temperature requirement protein LtrA
MTLRQAEDEEDEHREQRVTALELFFDLVFVFAITQVTGFLADHLTWFGLLQGLFLLGALWWAWASYAWLTNTLNPEEGAVRIAMFGSMGAMLIVSLAVPYAFETTGVLFGVAYFIVRALHLVLYAIGGRDDPELESAILRLAPSAVLGGALLILAGFFQGSAQMAIWAVALGIDYLWIIVGGMHGWRVMPEHFVERHGLVLIIALGESIVAIGVGAAGIPLDAGMIAAALLGIVVAAALWWSYFDWVIFIGQARLSEATGDERAVLARDLYSYLHLPMVAGIVLSALGLKTTLSHVYDPLDPVSAVGLCGGLALYMAAHVAHRLRLGGGLGHGRPTATVVLLALIPVALQVPALVALGLVAAVCVGLIAYEALRYRYARAWIRRRRGAFTMDEASHFAGPGSGPLTCRIYACGMSTDPLPIGPDREALTRLISERWPDAVVLSIESATFFSLDEKHWPNFATIVWTDEHDLEPVSDLSRRPEVYRLNIGVGKETFQHLASSNPDPDYAALDRLMPHPVYAKQRWISILNPSDASLRDIVLPLLTEAHDRLAAARDRRAAP